MDFSDDEDFFARAGEDEYDQPFEGYECYQPHEELPPEEEMSVEAEQIQVVGEHDESSQPPQETMEQLEELSTSPSRPSDVGSPTSSSSPPTLPLQAEREREKGRKRMREKTKPAGLWIGIDAPAPATPMSYQPSGIPIPSIEAATNAWWDGIGIRNSIFGLT